MKNIKYIICLVLFISLIGCNEEFLEEVHPTKATSGSFFENDGQVMEAVLSIYAIRDSKSQTLGNDLFGNEGYNGLITNWDVARGDNFIPPKDGSTALEGMLQLNYNPSTGKAKDTWAMFYKRIYRANWVIDNVKENPNISDAVKTQALGEAYFMRGFFYFNLTRLYEQVPIVISAGITEDLFPEKASNEECWAQAVSDMEESLKYLPDPSANVVDGRANLGVANAILARAYLNRTRPGSNQYWDKVQQYTKAVEELGVYSLEPIEDIGEIFVYTQEGRFVNNSEMIWATGFVYGPYDGSGFRYERQSGLGTYSTTPRVGRYVSELQSEGKLGDGGAYTAQVVRNENGEPYHPGNTRNPNPRFSLSEELSDIMIGYGELGDKRTSEYLWYPTFNIYKRDSIDNSTGEYVALDTIDVKKRYEMAKNGEDGGEFIHVKKYVLREFIGTNIWDGGWHHTLMFPVIKYDDVLLMRAEAEYHLGNEGIAKSYLQQITDRAGFDSGYLGSFSGQTLLDEILQQRRVELLLEGQRVPDLIRLDMFKPPHVGNYPGSVVFEDKYKIVPIPLRELDWNPNLRQHSMWE